MRRRTLICTISIAAYALLLTLCAPAARMHMLMLRRIYATLGHMSALAPHTIAEPLALLLAICASALALRAVYRAVRRRSAVPIMRFASGFMCFALMSISAFSLIWPAYLPQDAAVHSAYSRAYDISQLEALISALTERARADEALLIASGKPFAPSSPDEHTRADESVLSRASSKPFAPSSPDERTRADESALSSASGKPFAPSAPNERTRADESVLSINDYSQAMSAEAHAQLPQRAAAAYSRAGMGDIAAPKPARWPEWMSYLRAAGMFIPFTGETIYDPREPDFILPFTMLHELAHASGVVHEDEANLLALRIGLSSGDAVLSRASALSALRYALMTLRELDEARFERACAQTSPQTLRDLNALGMPVRGKNARLDALTPDHALPASSNARDMFARKSGLGDYDGVIYLLLNQYGASLSALRE